MGKHRRIVAIGSAGFIGSHLVDALLTSTDLLVCGGTPGIKGGFLEARDLAGLRDARTELQRKIDGLQLLLDVGAGTTDVTLLRPPQPLFVAPPTYVANEEFGSYITDAWSQTSTEPSFATSYMPDHGQLAPSTSAVVHRLITVLRSWRRVFSDAISKLLKPSAFHDLPRSTFLIEIRWHLNHGCHPPDQTKSSYVLQSFCPGCA